MVGPSPVTSNGTETTEIDDDEHDEHDEHDAIEIVEDSDHEEQEQDTRPRSDVPVRCTSNRLRCHN